MLRLFASLLLVGATAGPVLAQADGALNWAFTTLPSTTPGAILSSPAIGADGTVYFGVQAGSTQADASGRVFAVTPAGALKWSVTLPDWVDSSPAIGVDGTIYVGCWDGRLYAFAPDGEKKWEYLAGGYIASSPSVSGDGTIHVGAGDFNLHAVNPDGTLKWLYPTADWVDGSPAVDVDGTVYVGAGRTLYAVSSDGAGLWQAALLGGIVGAPAIAADGTVYVGARDKKVYAFSPDGTLRWFFETGDGVEASPAIGADGTIYIGSLDGRFYAVGKDGVEKWRYPREGQPALEPIYSSAAVRADGSVVFGTSDSAVFALTVNGTLLWRTPIGDWADSSPVVAADGTIYIGSYDKRLYSLAGSSGAAASDWPMFRRDAARTSWQPKGLTNGGEGRLINASVRSAISNGSSLTVGFSVAGSGERTLLARGVGPALSEFGLNDALADPHLRIIPLGETEPIEENSSWSSAPNVSEIMLHSIAAGAFPLPNPSNDTAVVRGFAPGSYTAVVDSSTGNQGVALTELYDRGGASSRLVNLSALAPAAPGEGVLTAGFVVEGGRRTLLIRGIGPTLANFGVDGPLANPRLVLFDSTSEAVAENDNWSSAPNSTAAAAGMQMVGAFALAPMSKDAALLVLVDPGAYTVQVSGVDDASGIALIEVYELP